jgi:hypothetical protein
MHYSQETSYSPPQKGWKIVFLAQCPASRYEGGLSSWLLKSASFWRLDAKSTEVPSGAFFSF